MTKLSNKSLEILLLKMADFGQDRSNVIAMNPAFMVIPPEDTNAMLNSLNKELSMSTGKKAKRIRKMIDTINANN